MAGNVECVFLSKKIMFFTLGRLLELLKSYFVSVHGFIFFLFLAPPPLSTKHIDRHQHGHIETKY
jgi:hypothetical protein